MPLASSWRGVGWCWGGVRIHQLVLTGSVTRLTCRIVLDVGSIDYLYNPIQTLPSSAVPRCLLQRVGSGPCDVDRWMVTSQLAVLSFCYFCSSRRVEDEDVSCHSRKSMNVDYCCRLYMMISSPNMKTCPFSNPIGGYINQLSMLKELEQHRVAAKVSSTETASLLSTRPPCLLFPLLLRRFSSCCFRRTLQIQQELVPRLIFHPLDPPNPLETTPPSNHFGEGPWISSQTKLDYATTGCHWICGHTLPHDKIMQLFSFTI